MTWEEICDDPNLRDLPYKLETNRRGQIVMSPARSRHSEYQSKIILLLWQLLPHGLPLPECPVQTTAGVRVPDVAWTSQERRHPIIYTLAPEICIEIASPFNDQEELDEKRALYFEAGALESWLCDMDGEMTFHGPNGLLPGSLFCPDFPAKVEV